MLNTIEMMDDFEQKGFSKDQAKTLTVWMKRMNENLATKEELKDVVHSVEKLSLEFRHESQNIRKDIENLGKELRSEMDLRITKQTNKLGGFLAAGIGFISLGLGIIAYLIKF